MVAEMVGIPHTNDRASAQRLRCLLYTSDNSLATAVSAATAKSGYYFTYSPSGTAVTVGSCTGNPSYTVLATPSVQGQTGQRLFFSDETGVIRFTTNATTPTVSSSPLQ